MQLLGYGEDALTYWALTQRLGDVLRSQDEADSPSTTVFFRPSFGRRSAGPAGSDEQGPQFGEFDGIVAAPSGVYLIEAKWSNSAELRGETLSLRPEQIRRHRLFRTYLDEWRKARTDDWAAFVARHPVFHVSGDDGPARPFRTAPAGSVLARNLETVLRRCASAGSECHDVLLLVHPGPRTTSASIMGPAGFKVVELDCLAMDNGFIVMPMG